MEPTTALIAAVIGAVAAGLVNIIKALFSRNENRALVYQHEERLIELCSRQTDSSDKLAAAIEGLRDDITGLSGEITTLNTRVLKLELERNKD